VKFIEDIHRISYFLPILLILISLKRNEKAKWVVFYFTIFITFHNVLYASILKRNENLGELFNHLFIPVEFLFISYYFYSFLKLKQYKKIVLFLSLFFFLLWLIFLIKNPHAKFDSVVNGIESLFIILFSILFYYEQIKYPVTFFIYMKSTFWVSSGFFLFACITFFVFIYRQAAWHEEGFIYQYAYIHALSGILRNILFSISTIIPSENSSSPEFS
jgi:hypothetical protein